MEVKQWNLTDATHVKVWNRNSVEHIEQFMGKEIKIPAGGFIRMGRSEAVKFRGQYYPIKMDGQNRQTVSSMKILELEPWGHQKEAQVFLCHRDGTEHASQAELDKYIADNFAEELHDVKVAEELKKKVKKSA